MTLRHPLTKLFKDAIPQIRTYRRSSTRRLLPLNRVSDEKTKGDLYPGEKPPPPQDPPQRFFFSFHRRRRRIQTEPVPSAVGHLPTETARGGKVDRDDILILIRVHEVVDRKDPPEEDPCRGEVLPFCFGEPS
jgi:hypothetical protein